MARTTVTTITLVCDVCKEPIVGGYYVDAMTYGVTIHEGCWEQICGGAVARLLGLDEIRVRWALDDTLIHGGGRYGDRG